MIKLYKREDNCILYAECWVHKNVATIHLGTVGDTGQSQKIACDDETIFMYTFQRKYAMQSYTQWPEEQNHWVVLQWPMKTLLGSAYNRGMRDKATAILNELLGWRGLGLVDGFDMGRTFNPKEEFALNIFCVVVDSEIAIKCIVDSLPTQLNCSRLKIASRTNSEDIYTLKYCAKEKENWFYV
jgi:hypothetical protein